MDNNTICFSSDEILKKKRQEEIAEIVKEVYAALEEKGYNPTGQLAGYIISGDPTYITAHKGARGLVRKVSTYEILEFMLEKYLEE